jgi:hypothetical protein
MSASEEKMPVNGSQPSREPPEARRRFPRHPIDIRVAVSAFRSGETISLWGRSNEMGADGIGATLTGELQPGEVVSLELALPMAAQPVKIRALVRYRVGLRHGFEFLTLSPDQRDVVDRVCRMLAAQS